MSTGSFTWPDVFKCLCLTSNFVRSIIRMWCDVKLDHVKFDKTILEKRTDALSYSLLVHCMKRLGRHTPSMVTEYASGQDVKVSVTTLDSF